MYEPACASKSMAIFYLSPCVPLSILRQAPFGSEPQGRRQDGERSRTVKWRGVHPEGIHPEGEIGGEVILCFQFVGQSTTARPTTTAENRSGRGADLRLAG